MENHKLHLFDITFSRQTDQDNVTEHCQCNYQYSYWYFQRLPALHFEKSKKLANKVYEVLSVNLQGRFSFLLSTTHQLYLGGYCGVKLRADICHRLLTWPQHTTFPESYDNLPDDE